MSEWMKNGEHFVPIWRGPAELVSNPQALNGPLARQSQDLDLCVVRNTDADEAGDYRVAKRADVLAGKWPGFVIMENEDPHALLND